MLGDHLVAPAGLRVVEQVFELGAQCGRVFTAVDAVAHHVQHFAAVGHERG